MIQSRPRDEFTEAEEEKIIAHPSSARVTIADVKYRGSAAYISPDGNSLVIEYTPLTNLGGRL
jgi:hypothetical protein